MQRLNKQRRLLIGSFTVVPMEYIEIKNLPSSVLKLFCTSSEAELHVLHDHCCILTRASAMGVSIYGCRATSPCPGSVSVPCDISQFCLWWCLFWDRGNNGKAAICPLLVWESRLAKISFWNGRLSTGRHTGSTALFQSLPWNSIRPSFHDSLLSTSPLVTPWGCLCRSGSWSQGCPWPHRSHGRASCGCCQNRPRCKVKILLPGWISPGQSSQMQLVERRLWRRRQPLQCHWHPAWAFSLQIILG